MVAAVAAGAFVAAGQTMQLHQPDSNNHESTADGVVPLAAAGGAAAAGHHQQFTGVGGTAPAPEVLPVTRTSDQSDEVNNIVKSQQIEQEIAAYEAELARPKFWLPAEGRYTSGFGARWGTTHYGIDIANAIGTPIRAAHDGTVIEAGPASGFGLWVRVQADDGTITVYGHINTYSVYPGQKVKAGEQIAEMGNRGFSTGPHLHFEVWDPAGRKINPEPWLNEHGIYL
ncbi:peptidoglycan DD-metalloendopeptidase family protein [Actinoalloteichus spitiensis]|uniref:M23 family metallopeptidase n=1 Tax=Actinoalloteichus spitiensis TaxID=252394 RepID=UPI00037EAE36